VIVSGYVPVLVLVDNETVSVDVAVGFTAVGSWQVAPGGQPATARSTVPLNPFRAVTVTLEVPVPTCTSVNDDGLAEIEKSGGGGTVSKTVVETTDPSFVPVIVNVKVPTLVLEVVKTSSTDVAVGFGVTGVPSVQVVFAGQPVTVRLTAPLNPVRAVTVTVVFPAVPRGTVNEDGLTDSEKFGGLQDVNLKEPNAVCQLKLPFDTKYSLVYQKVQSSAGSIRMAV